MPLLTIQTTSKDAQSQSVHVKQSGSKRRFVDSSSVVRRDATNQELSERQLV